MARKHAIYWYEEEPAVAAAFLFNCHDDDLRRGGRILAGSIVRGTGGPVASEKEVFGLSGTLLAFQPTRRCEWQGHELRCMVHAQMPSSAKTKAQLRPYNYVVAELETEEQACTARNIGVPVVTTPEGRRLVNLECSTFEKQGAGSRRRAKMM
jgi:hypothetical protein